jgi:hypothetical protein
MDDTLPTEAYQMFPIVVSFANRHEPSCEMDGYKLVECFPGERARSRISKGLVEKCSRMLQFIVVKHQIYLTNTAIPYSCAIKPTMLKINCYFTYV